MIESAERPDRRLRAWSAAAVLCSAMLATAMVGTGHAASEAAKAASPHWATAPEQVAVTGIITRIAEDDLFLSYGEGELVVSMAGWDWYQDDAQRTPPRLSVGEGVTVTGAVDAELFRRRMLRAQSIYVQDRHSYFTAVASAAKNAPWSLRPMPVPPLYGRNPATLSLTGEVSQIADEGFSLDLGSFMVSIDTAAMTYDPLDEIGAQRLRTGDWVQVGGELSNDFFTDRRLDASRITSVFRMGVHAM